MPRVRAAEREVSTAPIPGVRKTTGGSAIAEGAGVESAKIGAGEAIARVGNTIGAFGVRTYAEIQEESRRRADSVAILEAERKIGEWENKRITDVTVNVLGKDAMGLPETIAAEYATLTGEIEKGLGTDRQREAFARLKTSRGLGIDLTLQRHVAKEIDRYESEELEGTIVNSVQAAQSKALDPSAVAEELDRAVGALKTHLPRLGFGPQAIEKRVAAVTTEIHAGVIDRLLSNDLDQKAKAYFEEVRGQISGPQLARLEEKVRKGTADGNGEREAAAIWDRLGPTTDKDAISIDKMEDAARAKWGEDTESMKATIAAIRSRAQGVQAGRREREDTINSTVWGGVVNGRSFAEVRRTPEFRDLSGEQQTRVRDYYENTAAREESRAAARDNRAITAEARKERKLELEGWSEYLDFKADPAKLRSSTPGEILKRLPELGQAHVNRLLEDREKLLKDDATFRAAVVDRDLFNEVMNDAGVPGVYAAPGQRTKAQKADLGKLLSTIEEAIGRKQVAAGRRLTREETETIAKQTVDAKVLVKDGWFSNDERFPALLKIDDVPADVVPQILKALAARGITNPTDQDVIDTFAFTLPKVKR